MTACPATRVASRPHRPAPCLPVLLALIIGGVGLGCGSSGNDDDVLLPGGGVAIGNLVCSVFQLPAGNAVVQGGTLEIQFTLTDVNYRLPGADLPISFEVGGGSLPDPPDRTNASGQATVVFVADPDFMGAAFVRLIQPDRRLRCDVSFSVYEPACTLTAQVLDGTGTVIEAFDACGSVETDVERPNVRRVVYEVRRPEVLTGFPLPAAGAFIRLTGLRMNFDQMVIGPTNAQGRIEAGDTDGDGAVDTPIAPLDMGVGISTVTAEVIIPDANGDGIPDGLACNTCAVSWSIVDPTCDLDASVLPVQVFDAGGTPKAEPVRPGESATVTAVFEVDGVPQAGVDVLAFAGNGRIDGSGLPVEATTDATGSVTFTYTPNIGFSGTDVITIEPVENLTCVYTAEVDVVTCDFTLAFFPDPVRSGQLSTVTMTLPASAADPATADGESIALSATGGFLPGTPPSIEMLAPDGLGNVQVTFDYVASLGFVGTGSVTASFVSGYPCLSVTEEFPVMAP
jgi:hypothetical protein